jgi:hypothetical protein
LLFLTGEGPRYKSFSCASFNFEDADPGYVLYTIASIKAILATNDGVTGDTDLPPTGFGPPAHDRDTWPIAAASAALGATLLLAPFALDRLRRRS